MAREWDPGLDAEGLVSSLLTPFVAPGAVPFDASGLRQSLQNIRKEKADKAASDQRSGDAAARLAFDKEKWGQERELKQGEATRKVEKDASVAKKEAGQAYEKSLPGLLSGDQGRSRGELNKLESAGFEVTRTTPDDGVLRTPTAPKTDLTMPGATHAPGMTGPAEALSDADLDSPGLPGDGGDEAAVTGSLEGFNIGFEMPELGLGSEFDEEGADLQIVAGSERDIFHIKSPDGTDLGTFDIKRQGKNNVSRIRNTLGKMAEYYSEQHPLPASLLDDMAEDIATTVLSSPDGTMEDALQVGMDMFLDLVKEENSEKRAAMMAQAKQEMSVADVERGIKTTRVAGAKAAEAKTSLESLKQATESLDQAKMDIADGKPMDSIKFIGIMYDIIRSMEGKGARITDNDFKRAFGISSWSEDMSNFAAGKLSIGSFDDFKSMMGGTSFEGGEVSLDRLDRVSRYVDDEVGKKREVYDSEFPALAKKWADAKRMEAEAYANGIATEIRGLYPEHAGQFPITTPNQAVPVLPTPAQPPAGLPRAGQAAPAPQPAGSPEQQQLNDPSEPWNQ